jgi:hypothetical protein
MVKFKAIALVFLVSLISATLFGQPQNIQVSSASAFNPNEVSVSFNPQNSNELVIGSNLRYVYFTTDGGATWQENDLTSGLGERGDPVIVTDTLGNFYYVHIGLSGLVCQRAPGATGTWNNGSTIVPNGNKFQDKPWSAVDFGNNIIYTTWTQYDATSNTTLPTDCTNVFISHSKDLAATWSAPRKINKMSGDCQYKDVIDPTPCLGQTGTLYVAWEDSTGILFNSSLDTGNTWKPSPVFVSTIPGGCYYHVPGIPSGRIRPDPVTACDLSNSPYRGTVYIVWSDQRNGPNNTDVFLVKSTDGGNTWSTPAKVNDDNTNTHQFFGTLTVDQSNGNLYVLFYDRRNFADTLEVQADVYMAMSKDGGTTFSNYKISQTSFICDSTVFIGDYIGIAAQKNQVRPVWTRNDNSQTSIWTALVDATTLGIQELNSSQGIEAVSNYPNPFTEQTTLAYTIHATTTVTMLITDVYGKQVAVINRPGQDPGRHTEIFDNRNYQLAPGIYFYTISADGLNNKPSAFRTVSGKMVLLK